MIPTYLEGFVKGYEEDEDDFSTMILCSSSGNDLLELWYYGDVATVDGDTYITGTDSIPAKVVARDPKSGEEILIFDEMKHGYDSMFCNDYSGIANVDRPLKRHPIPPTKLKLVLEHSIAYEEEKDIFNFQENGSVRLIDGSSISWEDLKRNGISWITLYYLDENFEYSLILDNELS